MHILLTRPEQLSEASALLLRRDGHSVTIAPTSEPKALDHPLHEAPFYIVSSRHGVSFGLAKVTNHDATVFAVGEKAALAARDAGFHTVFSALDATALIAVIQDTCNPEDGTIIHLCGAHISTNISAALTRAGYDALSNLVYEAKALPLANAAALAAFQEGAFECVFFYSARAVAIFEGWVKDAGAAAGYQTTTAVVLSKRVSYALSPQWKKQVISPIPDEKSLFKSALVNP